MVAEHTNKYTAQPNGIASVVKRQSPALVDAPRFIRPMALLWL